MKPHQPNPSSRGRNMSHQAHNMQRGREETFFPTINLGWIFSKLLSGLSRIFVALKHKLYQMTLGHFEGIRLPWLKIGVAAFFVFLLAKKDFQFSVNMRAPMRTASTEQAEATGVALRQNTMSLGQGMLLQGSAPSQLSELDPDAVKAYIKRFSRVAIAEMQKYGIPASVNMGQAILESRAGTSNMVREENNHFGRPLSGKSYASAWENWRTHSLTLKSSFPEAFENGNSYKKWAKALKAYSQDRNYAEKLLNVIDTYQLYLLDEEL